MSLSIENGRECTPPQSPRGPPGGTGNGCTTPPCKPQSARPVTPGAPVRAGSVLNALVTAIEPLVTYLDTILDTIPMCRQAANVGVFDAQFDDLYRVYRTEIDDKINQAFSNKRYLLSKVDALKGGNVHAKRMIELYQMTEDQKEALFAKNLITCRKHETAKGVEDLFGPTDPEQKSSP